jgi:hypothetical protein
VPEVTGSRTVSLRIGVLVSSLILLTILALSAETASSQAPNRAAVVVRLADDRVETQCVSFEEDDLSGYELLQRAGLSLETRFEGGGGIMCRIEEIGCPSSDCFCECPGGDDCVYWSYWHLGDTSWQYAGLGATSYRVGNGDVDGWSWGPGNLSNAVEPPLVTFEEACRGVAVTGQSQVEQDGQGVGWMPLLAFGVIVVVLGLALLLLRRSSQIP